MQGVTTGVFHYGEEHGDAATHDVTEADVGVVDEQTVTGAVVFCRTPVIEGANLWNVTAVTVSNE
jgi:hypothetical protein